MEIEPSLHANRAITPTPHSLHQRPVDVNVNIASNTAINGDQKETRQYVSMRKSTSSATPIQPSRAASTRKDNLNGPRKHGSNGRVHDNLHEFGHAAVHLTPETTSAGRQGRQFAVANVGHNGRIFLRPTIKAADQRAPQPSFVFPMTPPGTAGILESHPAIDDEDSQRDSLWTLPSSVPVPAFPITQTAYAASPVARVPHHHLRAQSFSTVQECQKHDEEESAAFKVVIDRPGYTRPSTSGEPVIKSMLEIPIPSWRLGTPRFSIRGTAFIRGSSYAGSDGMRSSIINDDISSITPRRSAMRCDRNTANNMSNLQRDTRSGAVEASGITAMSSAITGNRVIEPSMFDSLTFKPSCDYPSLARHASNGMLTAATPPRLVAEITSQAFLDYDLLSDFFLTFRSFVSTSDLLSLLIARLRWALIRSDGIGMIVRVRTFVALRHWILNYFMDDYVLDYNLRKMFCDLINTFVVDILNNKQAERNQIKILEEIKKCWRRTCSLFWAITDSSTTFDEHSPIMPGGVPGSRDPNLLPDFWARALHAGPPRLDDIFDHDSLTVDNFDFFANVPNNSNLQLISPTGSTDNNFERSRHGASNSTTSQESVLSREILSCSFPLRNMPGSSRTPILGPRPVPVGSSHYDTTIAASTTVDTGGEPSQSHIRSEKFATGDSGMSGPTQIVTYNGTELLMAVPYEGSLVRGHVLPPGEAFVNFTSPTTPAEMSRATTYFPKAKLPPQEPTASAAPGIKRILGSVRRVLATKTSPTPDMISSPTSGRFPSNIHGEPVHRVFDPATVSDQRFVRNRGLNMPTRIDLLGAGIAEDFKRAVREDAEADAEAGRVNLGSSSNRAVHAHDDENSERSSRSTRDRNLVSGITAGSLDIVIFDDTLMSNSPKGTGALATYPSIETIADSFIRPLGGLTPPMTPRDHRRGFPRRSSHLLGTPTYGDRRSLSHERTPSLERMPSLTYELQDISVTDQSPSLPRMLPISSRFHSRNKSSKSTSLLRYASFQSIYARRASETDFRTTSEELPFPEHPFVASHALRRQPGGNLRGITNIGELKGSHLRRTRSTGSFDTFSDLSRSSRPITRQSQLRTIIDGGAIHDDPVAGSTGTVPLGSVEGRRLPLYSTGVSGPPMHPSMEKELALLAQIPDDDDGGIESSLLKLEGKFDETRQSAQLNGLGMFVGTDSDGQAVNTAETGVAYEGDGVDGPNVKGILNDSDHPTEPNIYRPSRHIGQDHKEAHVHRSRQAHGVFSLRETQRSDESSSSVPLLQREQSIDMDRAKRNRRRTFVLSNLHGASTELDNKVELKQDDEVSNSLEDLENDDEDTASDISSEMSVEVEQNCGRYTSILPSVPRSTAITKAVLPLGALRVPSSSSMSMNHALAMTPVESPRSNSSPLLHSPQLYETQFQPLVSDIYPPTPGATPTMSGPAKDGHWDAEGFVKPSLTTVQPAAAMRETSVHLPFILAYDSKVLAEQFTLVEKDALNEIDWKELIDMRWRDTSSDTRSWVDFLRTHDAHGVEVVISRFNLVCKWAISEIVLCRKLEERVQCIIKYIHIAARCREYRNYATLYQITIALTGTEITRLKTTWSHVPTAEKRTLVALETLIQPVRNFHNLRAEMEGEGASLGCIPFIGVYTHDLLLNSQKPSMIASTPMSEPLVNFERCRTSASIVKCLLRLLEASQLYAFRPMEGLTQRCLWMAALGDEEIRRLGMGID